MRRQKGRTRSGEEYEKGCVKGRSVGETVCIRPIFFVCVTRAIEELKGARLKGREEKVEERNDNEPRVVVISFLVGWIRVGNPPTIN